MKKRFLSATEQTYERSNIREVQSSMFVNYQLQHDNRKYYNSCSKYPTEIHAVRKKHESFQSSHTYFSTSNEIRLKS